MNLYAKYFGESAQEEAVERAGTERRNAKIALFLRTDFLKEEFEPWLDTMLDTHDPKPNQSKEDMLYHIGVRDGLKLITAYLAQIRATIGSTK